MRSELKEAHREIEALREELASRQAKATPPMPEGNIRSLRRSVSFYCHPDRGGDELLMRRLNVLFDYLGNLQSTLPVLVGAGS